MSFIESLIIYFFSFAVCLYALSGIDFARIMKKGRSFQIQVLYLVLGMSMAYLLGKFIMAIMYRSFVV